MDPDACMANLLLCYHEGDMSGAKDCAEDLSAWLDRGGFEPDCDASAWRIFAQVSEYK